MDGWEGCLTIVDLSKHQQRPASQLVRHTIHPLPRACPACLISPLATATGVHRDPCSLSITHNGRLNIGATIQHCSQFGHAAWDTGLSSVEYGVGQGHSVRMARHATCIHTDPRLTEFESST